LLSFHSGVGFRPIKTEFGASRHEVLKIIMDVAKEGIENSGVSCREVAKVIGVHEIRISEVRHGRNISKKLIRLLIGYGYLDVNEILRRTKPSHIRILKNLLPSWA
jgi:predicted XRE-type DNA-binding protein